MKSLEELSILFVDDEQSVLKSLRRFLRKEHYQTIFAQSGAEALEIMSSRPVEIVVSDLRMPEMDGLELISKIKEIYPDTIRLILSANRSAEEIIESINNGEVFRFIPKPLDPDKFRQILMDAVDLYQIRTEREALRLELEQSYGEMKNVLTSLMEAQDRQKALEKRSREYERKIEQHLLQSTPPDSLDGATIAALSIPSGHLDGDFYDFIIYGKRKFDMIIADVMGKGVQSALVGAGFKAIFLKSLSMHDCKITPRICCSDKISDLSRMDEIMKLAHAMSIQELMEVEMFLTLCFSRFDLDRNLMSYIDCGHTKTIHYKCASERCSFLEGDSMPLGMVEIAEYTPEVVSFSKGDLFFFYSDGLTEASRADGEMFGSSRIADLIQQHNGLEPEKIIEKVSLAIQEFTQSRSFSDDFSCILIQIDS